MVKFRKKPVTIEAVKFVALPTTYAPASVFTEHPEWLREALDEGKILFTNHKVHDLWCGWIETLEGKMAISPGDYLIRGVQGELYPCKPDIFAKTYEPAE